MVIKDLLFRVVGRIYHKAWKKESQDFVDQPEVKAMYVSVHKLVVHQ